MSWAVVVVARARAGAANTAQTGGGGDVVETAEEGAASAPVAPLAQGTHFHSTHTTNTNSCRRPQRQVLATSGANVATLIAGSAGSRHSDARAGGFGADCPAVQPSQGCGGPRLSTEGDFNDDDGVDRIDGHHDYHRVESGEVLIGEREGGADRGTQEERSTQAEAGEASTSLRTWSETVSTLITPSSSLLQLVCSESNNSFNIQQLQQTAFVREPQHVTTIGDAPDDGDGGYDRSTRPTTTNACDAGDEDIPPKSRHQDGAEDTRATIQRATSPPFHALAKTLKTSPDSRRQRTTETPNPCYPKNITGARLTDSPRRQPCDHHPDRDPSPCPR